MKKLCLLIAILSLFVPSQIFSQFYLGDQQLMSDTNNGDWTEQHVVLYNTPELVPAEFAPFAGMLPPRSEEVSEEDSPVEILAPQHPVFNRPNRIGLEDFDGWVEQRGSKWWSEWDPAYTPLLETHDTAQEPQKGGWLYAPYGKGHYSYFAYAMHRQLPYGVPGAYRLFANVLALGKEPSEGGEGR